jgi:hypothetical protein
MLTFLFLRDFKFCGDTFGDEEEEINFKTFEKKYYKNKLSTCKIKNIQCTHKNCVEQ